MSAVTCPSCDVPLPGRDLREGWCDSCGKKIPSWVLHRAAAGAALGPASQAARPAERARPARDEDRPARTDRRGEVTLRGRDGVVMELLPSRCLCCGAGSTRTAQKEFTWVPFWVYLLLPLGGLPFIIIARMAQKAMTVRFPVCDRHRYPWLRQKLVGGAALAYLLVLPWFTIVLSVLAEKSLGRGNPVSLALLLGWPVGLLLWFVLLFLVKSRAPHARRITEGTITLGGVSASFASEVC